MGRQRIRTWAISFGWIGFIVFATVLFVSSDSELPLLTTNAIPALAVVIIASLVNLTATALMNHLVLHRLDSSVSISESTTTSAVASAVNYVAPLRAGAVFRSAYFKKTHGISIEQFGATLVVSLAAAAVAAGVGMLTGAALSLNETRQSGVSPYLLGLTPIVGGLALALIVARAPKSDTDSGFRARVSTFIDALRELTSDIRFGAALIALASLQVLAVIVGLGASIAAIGGAVDLPAVLVVGSIGVLAIFLSITPGGLGVYEVAVAVGGSAIGDSVTLYLGAAILQRVVGIVLTLLVAAPCWLILRRSPNWPSQWTLKRLITRGEEVERLL